MSLRSRWVTAMPVMTDAAQARSRGFVAAAGTGQSNIAQLGTAFNSPAAQGMAFHALMEAAVQSKTLNNSAAVWRNVSHETAQRLRDKVAHLLTIPAVRALLFGSNIVRVDAECSIMDAQGNILRPDCVLFINENGVNLILVVDFKLNLGKNLDEIMLTQYHDQCKRYCSVLREIYGYESRAVLISLEGEIDAVK